MKDRISLLGMAFFGYHGCFAEERAKGQRFLVDAVLYLDLAEAGRTDDLSQTVDYGAVFDEVRAIVEGAPCRLLETVAERVAEKLLAAHPALGRVRVTVHKPDAPLSGAFADAAVTIRRDRPRAEA